MLARVLGLLALCSRLHALAGESRAFTDLEARLGDSAFDRARAKRSAQLHSVRIGAKDLAGLFTKGQRWGKELSIEDQLAVFDQDGDGKLGTHELLDFGRDLQKLHQKMLEVAVQKKVKLVQKASGQQRRAPRSGGPPRPSPPRSSRGWKSPPRRNSRSSPPP